MKISRIRIAQFKQFRQAIDIRDLEPGINLFTGPNEAGKSTIVQAIRTAFLEKHRSGSVEDFRPWGESTASPTVELEFTLGGQPYRLAKSFLARKRCELQVGSRHLEGSDAEEHLAGLLGYQHADRGASKAEHWGIPGLLWIQQGSAQDIHDPVAHATDHLRHALNQSLGEVTSSGGDEVLARVESRRNELLTAATGKPRGPYAEALEKLSTLATALQQQDAEIATYRQSVDRLAALRREHAADEAEKPWEGFREQEKRATGQLESIRGIEESLRNERQRGSQLDQRIGLLRSQLDTFASQEQAQHTRAAALEAARQAEIGATALVEQWATRHAGAATRLETLRNTLRLARQEDTRRNLTRQLEDLCQKAKTAAEALARAEAEHARSLELQRQAAASEIPSADLKRLREQHQQLRELEIRQATAATRLQFALDTGCSIQLGGESVAGHGERLLLEATPLMLPGLGRLEITPGGADLAQLRREASEIADRQAALLQRLGLPTLEAAEARHLAHAQHLAEISAANATLKALAPKGLEALHTDLATQQARAGEIEQALSQLPAAPEPLDLPSITEAEAAEQAAAHSLTSIQESLHGAQLAAGKARTVLETAQRELQAAQALLDVPERAERVAATQRDLVDALAEQTTIQSRIAELDRQVAQARPEILQQDVERFRRSAEQHEKRFNDRRDVLMRLEVELQTAGAQGLEERRAELARDLAQAERRGSELENRARALDHLLKLLQAKRRALTRRLQAPLQKHLNRHLQLLFPQATLDIDEDLSPGPLMRTGATGIESGEFEALSFGAREQMGVISRLAYADLLREAGRPTLVILDDALVHSDEERLSQMKRVLFDAATRHQILLFSCHPGNWRDLGVRARSLEEVRAGA